jgi:hypothetical protein
LTHPLSTLSIDKKMPSIIFSRLVLVFIVMIIYCLNTDAPLMKNVLNN